MSQPTSCFILAVLTAATPMAKSQGLSEIEAVLPAFSPKCDAIMLSPENLASASGLGAFQSLLPAYDPTCDAMNTSVAPIAPTRVPAQRSYFDRPIPRNVHQVWFGDPSKMNRVKTDRWRASAARFGYAYRLWTNQDLPELQTLMPPENYALLRHFVSVGDYRVASDIARLCVIEHFGGLYADVDITAPTVDGALVDVAEVLPMHNIALLSEHYGRDVGSRNALFFCNGFMMGAAHHPVLQHLVNTLAQNTRGLLRHSGAPAGPESYCLAAYYAGPMFISRSINGAVTALPITYLESLNMVE